MFTGQKIVLLFNSSQINHVFTRGIRFCAIVLYSHIDLNALADGTRTIIDTSSRFDGTESKNAGVHHTSKWKIARKSKFSIFKVKKLVIIKPICVLGSPNFWAQRL